MIEQLPKPRIFISHASSDSWVARQLDLHIRGCGADTFLDCEHIEHGDDFEERIIDAAGHCTELLVLFTPTARERKYVWVEIGMFLGARKRIVAVLYGVRKEER
jgi:TIR domain